MRIMCSIRRRRSARSPTRATCLRLPSRATATRRRCPECATSTASPYPARSARSAPRDDVPTPGRLRGRGRARARVERAQRFEQEWDEGRRRCGYIDVAAVDRVLVKEQKVPLAPTKSAALEILVRPEAEESGHV